MPNNVELTATELATLDLLIAQKQENPDFITDVANAVKDIGQAVLVTAAAVAAIGGAHNIADNDVKGALNIAKNASLDELIELRKNALKKQ